MALSEGSETVVYTKETRTLKIEITTPKGGTPTLVIHRERVKIDTASGGVISTFLGKFEVNLASKMDQAYTVADKTLTLLELEGFISTVADALWQEQQETLAQMNAGLQTLTSGDKA